jgi:predicted amidohydrolase YtcJ
VVGEVARCLGLALALALLASAGAAGSGGLWAPWDPARGILIDGATVVTMDDEHTVIPHARVLVRDGRIAAVWRGPTPPAGVTIGDASVVRAGPQELLFPGLINLHGHPRGTTSTRGRRPRHTLWRRKGRPAQIRTRTATSGAAVDPRPRRQSSSAW